RPPVPATTCPDPAAAKFTAGVLAPPQLVLGLDADLPTARSDDWTGLAIPAAPILGLVLPTRGESVDDGGRQQQPELDEVAFTLGPEHAVDDLGLLDDDDLPLPLPAQLDPRLQRTARLASLDPNDGISL